MSLKLKFTAIAVLTSFAFWIPILTLFAQSRSVTLQEVYVIVTIYSFASVLLEYPTGVFGDLISHKYSVILGFFLSFIVNLFAPFYRSFPLFLVYVCGIALAQTLISGSDAAFRYTALQDTFKKDYPTIKLAGTVATLVGIAIGPLLYQINPNLPFWANGTCFAIAGIIALSIPYVQHHTEKSVSNAYAIAKSGIVHIAQSAPLKLYIFSAAVVGALAINLKWIYPTLFSAALIPASYWGLIISSLYIARMGGTFLYKKFTFSEKASGKLLAALILCNTLLIFITSALPLYFVLFAQFGIVGLLETIFDVEVLHHSSEKARASILSFGSLSERLASGIHLFALGIFSGSPAIIFMLVAVFILAGPMFMMFRMPSQK